MNDQDIGELFAIEAGLTLSSTKDYISRILAGSDSWRSFHLDEQHALEIVFAMMAAHMEVGLGPVLAAPLIEPYSRMALLLGGLPKIQSGEKSVGSLVKIVVNEGKLNGFTTKEAADLRRLAITFMEAALALAPHLERIQTNQLKMFREAR